MNIPNRVIRLAELIVDAMQDEPFAYDDFISQLEDAVLAVARDVGRHPSEWTYEQREYWGEQARYVTRGRPACLR